MSAAMSNLGITIEGMLYTLQVVLRQHVVLSIAPAACMDMFKA